MFLLYPSSGQGIMFDPPQDTGFYVCPTVEHLGMRGMALGREVLLQGYLAHKKQRLPKTVQ